jgi:nitroreductase
MKPVNNNTIVSQLNWRYATKKFDPSRKIQQEDWDTLEHALVHSPSSFGLQPWKFVVVDDPAVRAKLREASWGQPQITDASKLVVFAVRRELSERDVDRYMKRIAQVRSVPEQSLEGFRKSINAFISRPKESGFDVNAWASRQVYIALGTFLTSAAMLGIDACPMEGIDPAAYDRILGLADQGYATLCVATAGYRSPDDQAARLAKVRHAREDVILRV